MTIIRKTETFKKEIDLAQCVINYLEARGWEVYQEVSYGNGYPSADIVGVNNGLYWVIETKKSFGLQVLEQAIYWLHRAHFVSVGVPKPTGRKSSLNFNVTRRILRETGIGVIQADSHWGDCYASEDAKFYRKANAPLFKERCKPIFKTPNKAGEASKGKWSVFSDFRDRLIKLVAENPGISIKDAIKKMEHHYASDGTAKACVGRYISRGIISEITIIRGKGLFLQKSLLRK